ncbi:Uncharacterised protein [Serratia ficaria]|uniref:hypothetical protein n=1 Tax=Serratia ficaria TaxID=61651 RepID=UPI00217B1710|nr:hypothetical protein [Serratia ficaria]CAI2078282.1 Uncharacterised protein [Serratia ficaria]CAI2487947.1 Uncharacterised protein [Serratia ficaria]
MKKLMLIITAVLALNSAQAFSAPPVNDHHDKPRLQQEVRKKPHHNKKPRLPKKSPAKRPVETHPERHK